MAGVSEYQFDYWINDLGEIIDGITGVAGVPKLLLPEVKQKLELLKRRMEEKARGKE